MANSDASSTAAARNLVSFYFVAPKILLLLAPEPWRSTKRNSMFRESAMNSRTCSTSRRTYIVDVNVKCKCKFNVKYCRECLRDHPSEAHDKVLDNNPDRIGIWKCWFLRKGENRSTRRKTSRSKEENQQQTKPI